MSSYYGYMPPPPPPRHPLYRPPGAPLTPNPQIRQQQQQQAAAHTALLLDLLRQHLQAQQMHP